MHSKRIVVILFFLFSSNIFSQISEKTLYYSNTQIEFYKLYFVTENLKLGSVYKENGDNLYMYNENNIITDTLKNIYCNHIIPLNDTLVSIQGLNNGWLFSIKNNKFKLIDKVCVDDIKGSFFTLTNKGIFYLKKDNKENLICVKNNNEEKILFSKKKKKLVKQKKSTNLTYDFFFCNNVFYFFDFESQILNSFNTITNNKQSLLLPYKKNIYWEMLCDYFFNTIYLIKTSKNKKELYVVKGKIISYIQQIEQTPNSIFNNKLIYTIKNKKGNEIHQIKINNDNKKTDNFLWK